MNRIILIMVCLSLNVAVFAHELSPRKKGAKYIYVDKEDRQAFKKKFTEARGFQDELAAVLPVINFSTKRKTYEIGIIKCNQE